jgi:hypothetical protein
VAGETIRVIYNLDSKPSVILERVWDLQVLDDGTIKVLSIDELDTDGRSWKRWSYNFFHTDSVKKIEYNPDLDTDVKVE